MAKYPDFVEVCGYGLGEGIGGWNCRHSFWTFVEGVMERTYTDRQLAEIDRPPFEYEGRTYDAYQATQKQREIERTIRREKRLRDAYKAAGLTEDAQNARIRLRRLNEKYREFSAAAGLPEQRERTKVLYAAGKSVEKTAKSAIIKKENKEPIFIGKSLGAKAKNYEVIDKRTGIIYQFVEGTKIKNPTVFAGYRGIKPLNQDVIDGLVREFGGNGNKWQHAKGIAILNVDGEEIKAEVHWFQEETVGKVKFKVKEWIYD